MHVKRCALLVCALASSCSEPRASAEKRSAPVLTRATTDAQAPVAPVDPQFLALARTLMDAATVLAKSCYLSLQSTSDFSRYTDSCTWKAPERKALERAGAALRATTPDGGDASVFAEHARLFAEWVATQTDPYSTHSGTLAKYQELALAWNAFQPGETVAVDPKKTVQYYGALETDAGPTGHFEWSRCSSGPCIIVPGEGPR